MTKKKKLGSLTKRYKKQHGLHHKHSGRYLKVYWPYIPLLTIVLVGISLSILILASKPDNTNISADINSLSLLNTTNSSRKTLNLQPLNINNNLNTAAQIKANDMAIRNYWSPVNPDGQTPWELIKSTGYRLKNGSENLAYGFNSSSSLMSAWLNSNSHKSNMLNYKYNEVGFGIVNAPNFQNSGPQTIVVALYASSNQNLTTLPTINSSNVLPSSQVIVKSSTLFKNNNQIIFITGLTLGVLICFLVIKHGLILRKWAIESEELVVKHPVIDILLVIVIIGLASLNQTIGLIN